MAKLDVQIPDIDWNSRVGQALQRAVSIVGWSNKEAAAEIGVDDGEFGKWVNGARRPHTDRILAVSVLRWPFIVALAEQSGEGVMEISLKRIA
jgi:hypothetical protein